REQKEYDAVQLIGQALPLLQQLAREREALRQARRQAREADEELTAITAHGKGLKATFEDLVRKAEAAEQARRQAEAQATAAHTRWQLATGEFQQLDQVAGEKRCRFCGQELTAAHLDAERRRRRKTQVETEEAHKQAEALRRQAVADEQGLLEK